MHLVDHLLPVDDVQPSHGHIHVTAFQSQTGHQGTELPNFRVLAFEGTFSDGLNFGEDDVPFNLPLINIFIDSLCVLVDVFIELTVEGVFYQLLVIHLRNNGGIGLTIRLRSLPTYLFIRLEVIDGSAHVCRGKALASIDHLSINRGHDSRHWALHAVVAMLREYLLLLHRPVRVLVGLEVGAASEVRVRSARSEQVR